MTENPQRLRRAVPAWYSICLGSLLPTLLCALFLATGNVNCQSSKPALLQTAPPALEEPGVLIVFQNSSKQPSQSSSPGPTPQSSTKPPQKSAPKPSPKSAPEPSPKSAPKPSPTSAPKPSPKSAPKPSPKSTPKPSPKSPPKPATNPAPKVSPKSHPTTSSPRPSPRAAPRRLPPTVPRPPARRSARRPSVAISLPPSPLSTPTTPPSPKRTRNGLRLVRGAAGFGRLEVRVVPEFFLQTGYTQNDGWAPLCDDGSFDDQRAQEFCQILGYKFGRKHYRSGVSSFSLDEVQPLPSPLGDLACVAPDVSWPGLPIGKIDLPNDLGLKCLLFRSACPKGELVALQCSNKPLGPKPPPPPRPPYPPPPPPPSSNMQHAVKLVLLEDNLLENWSGKGGFYLSEPQRVELLVNSSADGRSGETVWAPLCASADQVEARRLMGGSSEAHVVANTSCNQHANFPNTWFSWMDGVEQDPVPIPKGMTPPTGISNSSSTLSVFDPSRPTHWVTIVGGIKTDLRSIQQMQLRVSTKPCETGLLFSLTCNILIV